jgi:hypothetical protein
MCTVYVSVSCRCDWSEGQLTHRQQSPAIGLPETCL